jgi:hypothetical protein
MSIMARLFSKQNHREWTQFGEFLFGCALAVVVILVGLLLAVFVAPWILGQ